MEGEIDIEEHDVLDNPRIKHMFPDLALVKTEALDDDELVEMPDIDYIPANSHLKFENGFDFNEYDYYSKMEEEEEIENYTNKIILGSKPSIMDIIEEPAKEYLPAVVVLENWGDRLNNSSCFCKDCKILFATNNALEYHKMAVHSFLVALSNKAVKSTTRNSTARASDIVEDATVPLENVQDKSNAEGKLCNHCNKYFPDGNKLIKHLYELLTKDDATSETTQKAKSTKFGYHCTLCSKVFFSYHGSKHHVTSVHNKSQPEDHIETLKSYRLKPSQVAQGSRCGLIANVPLDPGVKLNYWHSSRTSIDNPPIPRSVLYKCNKCDIHFVMPLAALHHNRFCSSINQFFTCEICDRKMRCLDIMLHKLQHKVSSEFTIYQGNSKNYKKTLCKCPKCQVCYSESKFWPHYNKCNGNVLNCSLCCICKEQIDSHIASIHVNLHAMGNSAANDFIIIEFSIDFNTIAAENLVRTVESNNTMAVVSTETPSNRVKKRGFKDIRKTWRKHPLYYCNLCNRCMHQNRWQAHLAGNCRMIQTIICQKCGLTFSQKSIIKHRKLHECYKITLHDLVFFSQDGSVTVPNIPYFFRCPECDVHYLTKKQKLLHNCSETYEVCPFCSKRFSRHALKLHVPFHMYCNNIDTVQPEKKQCVINKSHTKDKIDAVKNYSTLNSMWNILFLCESCGLNTDCYDDAVSHSQRHLIGSIVTRQRARCEVCDLKFDLQCYKNHMHLHKQLPIEKKDFLILPYRFRALFKNQWFNLFGKLAPKKVQQIISQSIYKETRRANMVVEKNGQSDYTVHICRLCNICVNSQDINKHVRANCAQAADHSLHCKYCDIYFDLEHNHKRHIKIHKNIDVEFRIVKFERMQSIQPSPRLTISAKARSNRKYFQFYQCADCNLNMLLQGARMKLHICYMGAKLVCNICGLSYRADYKNNHYRLHKKYPKLTKKTIKCIKFRLVGGEVVLINGSDPIVPIPTIEEGKNIKTSVSDMETNDSDNLVSPKIYLVTCRACKLFFKSRKELGEHYPKCSGRISEPVNSGVEANVETNFMLYKCAKCLCHLLHLKTWKLHMITCGTLQDLKTCERCGLKFTLISLGRHKLRHHSGKDYSFRVTEPQSGVVEVYSG